MQSFQLPLLEWHIWMRDNLAKWICIPHPYCLNHTRVVEILVWSVQHYIEASLDSRKSLRKRLTLQTLTGDATTYPRNNIMLGPFLVHVVSFEIMINKTQHYTQICCTTITLLKLCGIHQVYLQHDRGLSPVSYIPSFVLNHDLHERHVGCIARSRSDLTHRSQVLAPHL